MITATITWSVSWSATGATGGGRLPSLFTSQTGLLRVGQVESVDAVGAAGGSTVDAPDGAMSTRLNGRRSRTPSETGQRYATRWVAPHSRRPLVAVASAVLVCASIAAFVSIYSSAGHKTAVIVVVQPIGQGQPITAADLGQVEVSVPSGVDTVPVADASELAGKRAVGGDRGRIAPGDR